MSTFISPSSAGYPPEASTTRQQASRISAQPVGARFTGITCDAMPAVTIVSTAAVGMLKPKATLKKIYLNTDIPTEELFVNADRQKITTILGNLISNTIEHTHEGDSIYVRVKDLRDRIGVYVEDNGPGTEDLGS